MRKHISPEHQKRLDGLACYLRELRYNENITQKEVCAELNIHTNSLCRIEGGSNTTLCSLFILCDFYGVPINVILDGLDNLE